MRVKESFFCVKCSHAQGKWSGSCNFCGAFQSIVEGESPKNQKTKDKRQISIDEMPVFFDSIDGEGLDNYFLTAIDEWDRVFGGGIVQGSSILLAGAPGIGKSTLLLTIAAIFAKQGKKVLYISSEETLQQIKLRGKRIGIKESILSTVSLSDIEKIIEVIEIGSGDESYEIVILDSLQNVTCQSTFLTNSIGMIRQTAHMISDHARRHCYSLIMTGHITKDGGIAGPKSLEHIVDVVAYFDGEEASSIRTLQTSKNRFGSTEEIGFFIMTEEGVLPCQNPQDMLIENSQPTVGSAVTWYREGSRTFFIEIQTLVYPSKQPFPQRVVTGIDSKQVSMIIAVLEKYLRIPFKELDIFCKTAGNMRLRDSQCELSIAAALLSSYFSEPNCMKRLFVGEINLSGKITQKHDDINSSVIESHGFSEYYSPKGNGKKIQNVCELLKIFAK